MGVAQWLEWVIRDICHFVLSTASVVSVEFDCA
jgi:hypothetical protein